MKNKILFITALVFFLLVNTKYFWEGKLGISAFPFFMLLFTLYFIIGAGTIRQLLLAAKEKFSNRRRIGLILFLAAVLVLSFLKPSGLINFESFEGKVLLLATREGAANCNTTFKLKEHNQFTEKRICFGIDENSGLYISRHDTIFFDLVKTGNREAYYQFAVIKKITASNEKILADLVFYKNINDTTPYSLWITKNELPK